MHWNLIGKNAYNICKTNRYIKKTGGKTVNKKTTKKLVGGMLIVAMIASIGAVLVTADTDETEKADKPFGCFEFGGPMQERNHPLPFDELTDEQQEEINALRQDLIDQDATPEEIKEAINNKLREFGIDIPTHDEILEEKIQRTSQRLDMLERKSELRQQGYDWDEIHEIIQEEYDIEDMGPPVFNHGGKGRFHGMHRMGECTENLEDMEDSEL